jgi:hypothetical protein
MSRLNFALSILAASFCVLATASQASAKANLSLSGDMNLIETKAGQKYKAQVRATAENCPYANKSSRDTVEVAANGHSSSSSRNSYNSAISR